MEDDSVAAFDDTVDERFYDERRERAQRRQRKRYHAVYVAPKWRAELPTATNDDDSDDGDGRQNHWAPEPPPTARVPPPDAGRADTGHKAWPYARCQAPAQPQMNAIYM